MESEPQTSGLKDEKVMGDFWSSKLNGYVSFSLLTPTLTKFSIK